jgi:transaldolase
MTIELFGDGIPLDKIKTYLGELQGFTTNPSLARKLGVENYFDYCKSVVNESKGLHVSLEILSDDDQEIERQARKLSSLGSNVYVKIPIVKTNLQSNMHLINTLLAKEIKINITAVFRVEDVSLSHTESKTPVIISLFAGRLADIGIDPEPTVRKLVEQYKDYDHVKVLWASTREVMNYYQAISCKAHIITITDDILQKLNKYKNWQIEQIQEDTVRMFMNDAIKSGFNLD